MVDRLSYHPCLAMWIGNVESEMICQKIGLERPMHGADLFEKQIPEWMKEQDPERFYLPSSPWGEKLMNGEEAYDHHNWDVWFKNLPYTEYANDHTTFASEFGVHAAPILATVKKGCGENVQLDDFAFHYFNRDQDLQCMTYYLKMHAGEPETLETYIDLSMLVQAEALSFACEHYRRRFPACGGALIWQLNDCCPCQSWSLIDVNLNPKAAYYAVKRSFAPVTVSLKVIDACTTEIWALNDSAEERKLRITVEVGSFVGEVDHQEALEIALQPGERRCIRRIAVGGRFYPNVIIGNRPRLYYLAAWLEGQPRPQIRFFVEHKERLMPRAALAVSTGSGRISIATHVFADFVKLDGDLEGLEVSDNYFHMPPHTSRTIEVTRIWGKPLAQRKIFIKALNSDAVGVTMTE